MRRKDAGDKRKEPRAVLGAGGRRISFTPMCWRPQGGTPNERGCGAASAPGASTGCRGGASRGLRAGSRSDRRAWAALGGRAGGAQPETKEFHPVLQSEESEERSDPNTVGSPDPARPCWPNCRAWRRPAVAATFFRRPAPPRSEGRPIDQADKPLPGPPRTSFTRTRWWRRVRRRASVTFKYYGSPRFEER